jgi:glycosyltransferase involved in cell wall biosynthesis
MTLPYRSERDALAAPEFGLTVLFATHNGARTLPRMLAALAGATPPRRPWRVVAVDNASTDGSAEILRAESRLPLQVLHCATPGKMRALIEGASVVFGDLVVITDDDVEPDPEWLTSYERAADEHPEAGLFGGPILPTAVEDVGPWFAASVEKRAELFAYTEIADGLVADAAAQIFGPNFMLRREHLGLLREVGTVLGPTFAARAIHSFPMGEDTLLVARAQERAIIARGVAGARVRHMVRGFQTDLDYMLERAIRHGRGWAIRYAGLQSPSLRRRLRLLLVGMAGSITFAGRGPPEPATFNRLWRTHWMRGVVLGALQGPFEPRRTPPPRPTRELRQFETDAGLSR